MATVSQSLLSPNIICEAHYKSASKSISHLLPPETMPKFLRVRNSSARGGRKIIRQSTKDFYGSENTLYDLIMMDYVITDFSKPIEFTTMRVNSKVTCNIGLL